MNLNTDVSVAHNAFIEVNVVAGFLPKRDAQFWNAESVANLECLCSINGFAAHYSIGMQHQSHLL